MPSGRHILAFLVATIIPASVAFATSDYETVVARTGAVNGIAGLDASGLVPVANLPGIPAAWGTLTGTLSAQTDLQTALDAKQATSGKGAANGYASLDASTLVPAAQERVAFARVATSDYTNSTVTPSNIPGLAFPVVSGGLYSLECQFLTASAATTTGVRPGFTFPNVNNFRATCQIPASVSALAWFDVTATGASCDATASQGNVPGLITIAGTIEPSADGTLQIQGESEVAASLITIRRGSWCSLRKY